MKITLLILLALAPGLPGLGQEKLAEYDWASLAKAGLQLGGELASMDGRTALKIANTNDTAMQVRLLTIEKPAVTKLLYGMQGEVRYENVRGDGYLEMWSFFPPAKPGMMEGRFFSRTLGLSGEMGRITGTANWRSFLLPFDRTGPESAPNRLEFNLYLPGRGTVYIGPFKLVQFDGRRLASIANQNAWWSEQTAGLIGGIGGSLLGLLGGLLGWLASQARARSFVLASMSALIGLGALLAATAILALGTRQPFAVWFPLVLMAALLLTIIPARRAQARRQYEETELRRMNAVDAMKA